MIVNEGVDKYYNEEKQLSQELQSDNMSHIHDVLENIINYHKNGKVGIVPGLEGGLAIDYIDIDTQEECRFILGFTELGYWSYCNTYKKNLIK